MLCVRCVSSTRSYDDGPIQMKEENANSVGKDDAEEVQEDDEKKEVVQGDEFCVPYCCLCSHTPFHCLCFDDLHSELTFMEKLNTVWTGKSLLGKPDWSKTGGLIFRASDIADEKPDIKESLLKYGEISLFTRGSPPVIFNDLPTPYPQTKPMFMVLYDPEVLSNGYRVAPFDAHPFYRYPYSRFYDPGRPCLEKDRVGHAEALYVGKSNLPAIFKGLEFIGTVSGTKMLSYGSTQDPKLDMFGLSRDTLPTSNEVDVATDPVDQGTDCDLINPRKFQNASGTPALGTLNAWQPYFDSIDTAMAVRNVNMLVEDDNTRLEMMKLWAGGVSPSIWPNKVLCADPKTNKSPVIGFCVAHHGTDPYSKSDLNTHGLDTRDKIKSTMHSELGPFMTYYFGDDDGKQQIDDLCKNGCVVELFNSVLASQGSWTKGTKNQWFEAVKGVTNYVGGWMTADKESQEANRSLTKYARQLPAYAPESNE